MSITIHQQNYKQYKHHTFNREQVSNLQRKITKSKTKAKNNY